MEHEIIDERLKKKIEDKKLKRKIKIVQELASMDARDPLPDGLTMNVRLYHLQKDMAKMCENCLNGRCWAKGYKNI